MSSVSVIIPSHDRPEATAAALRSALAQTHPVAEVVVVDDASSRPLTPELLGADDARLRILRLAPNRGASGARQAGVEAATGDVLAFLDSDDLWHPEKIARQLSHLAPMTAVACGWTETRGGAVLRTRSPVPSRTARDFFSGCWFCPGTTVVMARETFAAVGPLDAGLRRLEDLEWFARFGLAGGRLDVVPQALAEIAIGGRARRAPVEEAAARITDTLSRTPGATPDRLRALEAWLRVERAKAAWNEGHGARTARHLLHSLALRPRASLHLADWWTRPEATASRPTPGAAPGSSNA